MKVAIVCSTILAHPHGGIPSVNRQILRQLDRIASASGAALSLHTWVLHDAPASSGFVAAKLNMPSERLYFHGWAGLRSAMMAGALGKPEDPDVILTTHLGLSPVSRLLRGPHTIIYQFLHGVECWRPLPARTRWGLRHIDGFLSNSAFTHRRFLDYNSNYQGISNKVCWLGAPEERIHEDLPEASEGGGDLSVLIVGRMMGEERYKGHEQLLSVWPFICRRFPEARLDIVGGGNAAASLAADAERRGLLQSGAVKFWGEVSDDELRDHYRRCSIFAMPSRGEGFGLVYLEAMAFGKPCLASLDDAAPEVVLDEETGLLVRYADREGLLYALCRLLESEALRTKLGRAGRERVMTTFTERHFGERLWKALDLDRSVPVPASASAKASHA